ncbi:MAG: alpha/beta hydrolase [Acidobacteria bacterium]|nr:alpha/beta hydrolase [Acidobacteriota bacterium]
MSSTPYAAATYLPLLLAGLLACAPSNTAGGAEVPAHEEPRAVLETHVGGDAEAAPRPMIVDRVELRDLHSEINGVDYELRVSLPHGYEDAEERFPVVYILDADYSFLIARNITDHLAERQHLEEVIVVGIAYGGPLRYRENRSRDYTPLFSPAGGYGPEYQKVSGGGPAFLRVIEEEIVPFIDRHYRTRPGDRTLVGHSYGGLFSTWTMLTHPGLFENFVIVSPSLWYHDRFLFDLEDRYAAEHRSLPARAYLCAGSREDEIMPDDLKAFVAQLNDHHYADLELKSLVMEGETHNSIFPGCLSNGLRYVLRGR